MARPKTAKEKAVEVIPSVLEKLGSYLKDSKSEFLDAVSTGSSSIAFVIKIFGQPLIDRVNLKNEKNKLDHYGANTYLYAAIKQLQLVLEKVLPSIEDTYSIDGLGFSFEASIREQEIKSKKTDWVLFFQPKYHPIVVEVLSIALTFLKSLKIEQSIINEVEKQYFEGIEEQVFQSFGKDSYDKHIKQIKQHYLTENETRLLFDNISLAKIGFKENEYLNYEQTFGEWKSVGTLFSYGDPVKEDEYETIQQTESKLINVELLIDEYFTSGKDSCVDKILFLIADFGKGKSVFLKNYCANFSRKYLDTSSGFFPIYFNLRRFKDFDSDHHLGVIANYIEREYNIKINSDYFINRKYIFLIDSLDECGELTNANINKVIDSVKKIQNIDPVKYKYNRVIIASRPFDDGLKNHLHKHQPYLQKNSEERDVDYYISIYGFKKEQFNHWMETSIRRLPDLNSLDAKGLNKEIIQSIIDEAEFDIYDAFLSRRIISSSELRRPIFAYMIFQLISNSISADKSGKIGIYLSFLNLLTKEAKYVHDADLRIDLKDQFEARSILHATAAVWLHNRTSANKSEIKKADVCRALEGKIVDVDDNIVLNRSESKEADIEFLSHSYFGENDNLIHFQHQSFAEILVAEYFLKILLKYALDREFDFEQARIRLSLGEPTYQTINFFKELVMLLKQSVGDNEPNLEIRKLIFPLLASLATIKNNKITYSSNLFLKWYEDINFGENTTEIPVKALKNWPINDEVLERVCSICKEIVESKNDISILKGESATSLFNNEAFVTHTSPATLNIDKWIAFVCGNILYNDIDKSLWFNRLLPFSSILRLIQQNSKNIPSWIKNYFNGIYIENHAEYYDLSSVDLSSFNFAYSHFNFVNFSYSRLYNANFSNCTIIDCNFMHADLRSANFKYCKIIDYKNFALSTIHQGCTFPYELAYKSYNAVKRDYVEGGSADENIMRYGIYTNYGDSKTYINVEARDIADLGSYLGRLLKHGYDEKIWTLTDIKDAFRFESDDTMNSFWNALSAELDRK